jgi:hypothetical protein
MNDAIQVQIAVSTSISYSRSPSANTRAVEHTLIGQQQQRELRVVMSH